MTAISNMTLNELFRVLRDSAKPKGTSPVVLVRINTGYGFLEHHPDFVNACIDELETLLMNSQIGLHVPTNLEKLALQLLLSNAYLDPKT